MAAVYPTSLKSFTTKTNKVDVVDASHINDLQNEVVAIETEIGTNPAGSATDLTTRLARMMDADGSVLSSNAYSADTYPSQLYFRTDLETLYIRNSTNTSWLPLGGSLSNLLFQYKAMLESKETKNNSGEILTTELLPSSAGQYRFLATDNGAMGTMVVFRMQKISGISTLKIVSQIWGAGDGQSILRADIGAIVGSALGSSNITNPEWINFDMDISSLNNGTFYDVVISSFTNSRNAGYVGSILGFGS